ncbi:protein toll-like [Anneissia japonica]|uniref:protein toll-like n=1 Tax=Anneissia japonica TaxID=1529436 RepID=UPI0014258C2B|nr:protein toll-like [Anneissia japonica]
MENNSLRLIGNETFVNNTNLTHVYLHDNELEFLPEGIFDPINKLEVISLYRNPFQCACGNRWLKIWLKENIHIVHNPNTVMCFTSLGPSPMLSSDDNVFSCEDDKIINVGKNFTSIIVVSCVSAIFLAISVVIFKFRHAIRVILYARLGVAVLHNEDDQDNVKTYDAYICYSSKDLPIVMTSLIPRLEGMNPPFKLCIHDRDFPIGACIATTIIESVKASRRSIILLSRNFLASEWCIMEFKAAHRYALKHQKNHMIVVLLEPIPDEEILNEDIKFYLSTNTYVEWTDPWFWDKLYFALPKKNVNSEVDPLQEDNEGYQLALDEI